MRFLLLIPLILLFSCQSTKTIPADYEGQRIIFGVGGGFTGSVTTYCLIENGTVYRKEGLPGKNESEYEKVDKWNKKDRTAYFEQATEAISQLEIEGEPGNLYAFVECDLTSGKGRFTWDDGNPPMEDIMYKLYVSLMNKVKKQ
jgi:hypothetical protein